MTTLQISNLGKRQKQRTANSGLGKMAPQCSAATFMVNQSLALGINNCSKNATFAKPKNVSGYLMRQTILSILMALNTLASFGQDNKPTIEAELQKEAKVKIDSTFINYYVLHYQDTFYFPYNSTVIRCNHLQSLDKDHNKCEIYVNQALGNGNIEIVLCNRVDKSTTTFYGQISNGLMITGTFMIKSFDGVPLLTGQYHNNWKYGYWTSYYSNGQVQIIDKYIEEANDPVKTWEFSEEGKLTNFTDEETEIIKHINKNNN